MNASTNPVLLSVEGLSVALPPGGDRAYAVSDISFDLRRGEILCVVGESGSGKSVSANAIMGLLPDFLKPVAGRIDFDGRDLLTLPEGDMQRLRGSRIGMIFQEPMSALTPTMTVGDQIIEVMALHNVHTPQRRRARMLELLAYVGLPEPEVLQRAYPFRLSGGQRQRIMIAMALALEPALLIADEPTTALDVTTQAQILALIRKIQSSMGMAVLFITHDFGVVADIADRIVVMKEGVAVEKGSAAQVLNAPRHAYTRKLIAAVPHGRGREDQVDRAGTSPLLEFRGVHKAYASGGGLFARKRVVRAVDDISFSVMPGETLGVVGESGSGKSSVAKCLMKLQDIDAGEIWFNGIDIAKLTQRQFRRHRPSIQMIFQDPFASLNPRHTIGKILTDGPCELGMDRRSALAKARALLERVGLDPEAVHRYPNAFSGGQRQRVGISRALMLEPRLLVCDESVSALDVSIQAQVLELLQSLQQSLGVAMVFITHDLRVATQICHRLLVMHKGKVVEEGVPTQVLSQPAHPYTRQLVEAIPGRAWESERKEGHARPAF
ncbi:ABC transporter ATP-binding protein [Bordetella sp. N]|uniref:ABC transporter ATP-binding protein n=1 Tax=Bordetella sp. N TaxID=1746199 RepID=UPI000710E2B0|nr:ABC transporter ATP-binding protein [Bordetella sp. N]ALM84951.1 ABC transporter ATP-binding protein [Bordetella sp. N]